MRVAIVHDWLNGMRGGEKVLEELLTLYPGATIYTLFHERGKVSSRIESHSIVTSWLDRVPGIYRYYRNFLPLFPHAIESWDLKGFDLVISSSHAVAKGARVNGAPHICYCHTPMRYLWDAVDDYSFDIMKSIAMGIVQPRLQRWDCETANRVDYFISNSRFVRERIREYYGRDAEVVPPPIDTHFFTPSSSAGREAFYLAVGALVPYKRFDLVIQAFNRLGCPLVIAGDGPELKKLRQLAGSNVNIKGWVSAEDLRSFYRRAKALVCAAREDFGMTAVEAQGCGCPVIAFGTGGASDTVQDGTNGIVFAEQDAGDLVSAVHRFESMRWPVEQVRSQVGRFSREAFQTRIRKVVEEQPWQKQKKRRNFALQPA